MCFSQVNNIVFVIMTQPQEVQVRLPVLQDQSLVSLRKITHYFRQGGARVEH